MLNLFTSLSSLIKPISDLKKSSAQGSGSCRLKSIKALHHFRPVSASSLLNASCSLVSAWSFLEGYSDRYFRIFGNSALPLMVCLPLVTSSQVLFLLTLQLEPLPQTLDASYILLVNFGHTLKIVQPVIPALLSGKASGTKTGLHDAITGTDGNMVGSLQW